MAKIKNASVPAWVRNLRSLMEQHAYNPRSLSLKAGLNATAVRDMIEGRSRFPRYDTVKALAEALDTTPAQLMSDQSPGDTAGKKTAEFSENLELLTDIIARLQEVTEDLEYKLDPRDFAAMTATIYNGIHGSEAQKKKFSSIRPQIHDLLDYEAIRQRNARH